ncbi:MAG: hydroxymethylglutaryl-CoA lyase [Microthrixaceae bacterium]|nr:hydroxymethylglutaryl-CoA lyase [Microthrixaceae bacterium]
MNASDHEPDTAESSSGANPQRVEVVEVAARDGLQSDPTILAPGEKVELITRAVQAGLRRIEAVSFVNPKRVPQMAGAEEVMSALPTDAGASYIGLVLNERGFDRALRAGVDEINVVVVATDTFAERNQGADTDGLIAAWASISDRARDAGIATSVTVSASFGCPYEGEVPVGRVAEVVARVCEHAPDEVALADSIGAAVPTDVHQRIEAVREVLGGARLRCHFHNTRNTGLANAAAAVDAGVRVLDASLGGIGGCPFAPNATGNIPTEDLVYMLERMGFDTGVDLDALLAVIPWMEDVLRHPTPGLLARAGNFPGTR